MHRDLKITTRINKYHYDSSNTSPQANVSARGSKLWKSEDANSLRGLSLLLNGNRDEYSREFAEFIAKNHYYGYKVRL